MVILSNIDGIFDGDPKNPDSVVIREIEPQRDLTQYIQGGKSQFGRGGMLTKCRIAKKVADEGIEVIVANGKTDNILPSLLDTESRILSTRFIPSPKVMSPVKKWIAHSEGFAKGALWVNAGAFDALMRPEATSLLAIGVEQVTGEFEKDDIVTIVSPLGEQIGVGRVACDSEKARQVMGQKGGKPIVHYDYLYLD